MPPKLTDTLTPAQRKLAKKHGTPAEFAQATYACVPGDISMDEARAAVEKYSQQWNAAGSLEARFADLPKVPVRLVGLDGNAMNLIAQVRRGARKAGWPDARIKELTDEAMSGDYNHVLQTLMAVCKNHGA